MTNASVAVVVCAYTLDRWRELVAACEAVKSQLQAGDSLVLVIDHNDELLSRAQRELSATVVPNSGPRGLSGARNTGIEVSNADIIAFLDDDATPEPGWLEPLRATFADSAVMVVGGGVEPRWEQGSAPKWLPAEYLWVVGCDYVGLPSDGADMRNPIGANMAIRASAFDLVGGFSTGAGRVGTIPVGCEETEWAIRLKQQQPQARVVRRTSSRVRHLVPGSRQTMSYFSSRCFHEGRSKAWLSGVAGASDSLASERSYVAKSLTAAAARSVRELMRGDIYALLRLVMMPYGVMCAAAGYAVVRVRDVSSGSTKSLVSAGDAA